MLAKAELGAHLQHGDAFDQDIAEDAALTLISGAVVALLMRELSPHGDCGS